LSNRKADYTTLEREYVYGDISQSEMARREGLSKGTLGEYARRNEWDLKRDKYRAELEKRTALKTVEKTADQQAQVNDEIFKAMRATIYKYVEALHAGHVIPSTKEAVMAAEVIRSMFGEPDRRLEVKTLGINVSATGQLTDPEFLRRLEQLTRGVRDGDEPGGGPRLRIEGPRPN
jgi:hypothetical protein